MMEAANRQPMPIQFYFIERKPRRLFLAVSFRRGEEFLRTRKGGVRCFDRVAEEILAQLALITLGLWRVPSGLLRAGPRH